MALYTHYTFNNSIAPAARTSGVTGTAVDLTGCSEYTVLVLPGAVTDGTHTITLEDSPDNTTFTAVDPSLIIGTPSNALTPVTNANAGVQKLRYVGAQRYLRAKVAISGATTGGVYGVWIVTRPRKKPAA